MYHLLRLDYALTHLGWLGFLTALYFLCIGIWLANILWCRSKASVWKQRSEIFEEYKTLYARAASNQQELIEACDIHENRYLQQQGLMAGLQLKIDDAEDRCDKLKASAETDHETILQREKQLQSLYDKVDEANRETERERIASAKATAEQDAKANSLVERIAELESAVQAVNQEKQVVIDQLGVSRDEVKTIRGKYADLMQQFAEAKDQQATYSKLTAEQKEQLDALSSQMARLESSLLETSEEAKSAKQQHTDATSELQGLRNKYTELMQQYASAKEGESSYSQMTKQQQKQLDALSTQIHDLESTLQQTNLETASVREQKEATSAELDAMRNKYAELKGQYTTAKQGEESYSRLTLEQQEQLGALSNQIGDLESTLKKSNKETESVRKQQDKTAAALATMQSKYADLMKQYASAKEGEKTVHREHKTLQSHLAELTQELASAQSNLAEREGTCSDLSKELAKVRGELQERGKAVDELRSKFASTTAELDEAYRTLKEKEKVESSLSKVQSQLDSSRRQLVSANKKIENFKGDKKSMEVELADLGDQLLTLQGEYDTLKTDDDRTISTLQRQLDAAEQRLSEIIERPADADDLTEIVGISRRLEEQLNEMDLFRFNQIAAMSDKEQIALEKKLSSPGMIRDYAWVEQAKDLLGVALAEQSLEDQPEPSKPKVTSYVRALRQYGNLSVKIDEKLGVVFTTEPTQVDELTVISGIGKVNQKLLREHGIYRLQQIADWNEYNVWAFNQILQFKGRIEREYWVPQARRLVGLPPLPVSEDDSEQGYKEAA